MDHSRSFSIDRETSISGKPIPDGRKIVILSSHVFLEGFRKASIHFVARRWAAAGNDVFFTTVGHSALSRFKQKDRYEALRREQGNRYAEIEPHLFAGAYLPPLHAFSTARPLVNVLVKPFFALYGRHFPAFVRDRIEAADLVVIESGTPIVFLDVVRRLNPRAKLMYFCRDLLRSVGAAPYLREVERRGIGLFNSICVPSRRLGEMLPLGGKVHFVPQGIEGGVFDRAEVSPYPEGSRNAVAVGDMLFDQVSVEAMAAAAPDVTFHLFGIRWRGDAPVNIRVYGEQSFETLAAYIRHADIGLAPYRVNSSEVYLAESSLKLLQYGYCRLPVLLPDIIPVSRGNEITYSLESENDWRAIVDAALVLPHREAYRDGILTWDDVARQTLATVFA
ncbi:polysaccharide biosynthesis protein GumK [Shinella sp.]|uniref:GumK N-terminal domain-containing glycosyltransferase n=1 Tax=Shinella sp. TaxID=1870904 RepID=UPI0028A82AF6|nr:polysaccharide biosynthesis protein GumK [Shinella sp.]